MEPVKATKTTVLDTILAPLRALLREQCTQLKDDADNYKLSLAPFVLNLVFAVLNNIKSISLLITEIDSSAVAREIGLIKASKSMYSEAFVRYRATIFRNLFLGLLERLNFLSIPELQLLGSLVCVDGSLIPAIQTMSWATYKESANALKIHLALNLNRMIPVQIISTDANTSERAMLGQLLEAGVTYIADRGYLSFKMIRQVIEKQAFFIFRMKSNWQYTTEQALDVSIPNQWQGFVHEVTDQKIRFCNEEGVHRLVRFTALGELYLILTNRLDLKTHEIIMLYAYRWQIELFFRCIKRTFNAIHLWAHERNGVEIQFYLYLIVYLLLLSFKQQCALQDQSPANTTSTDEQARKCIQIDTTQSRTPPACGIVTLLGERLHRFWKIGLHWLTRVRNALLMTLDRRTREMLAGP
jgi:Transposase DDE domain